MNAPIIIFCYNRAQHFSKTISSLRENKPSSYSDLFVYVDGPRNKSDEAVQEEIQKIINSNSSFFKSCTVTCSTSNKGLANSIINGVTEVLNLYDEVIVLEDDMILSPHFLQYMNDGLVKYKNEPRVCSIHGYFLPITNKLPETFFMRGADCWGWATWKRAWQHFETDGSKLAKGLRDSMLIYDFNFNNTYNYYQMLIDQINKKNDSWAIRWHASNFLLGNLTLYPNQSLVHNIGLDGSGTHCGDSSTYDINLNTFKIAYFPSLVEESLPAKKAVIKFHSKNKNSLARSFFKKILRILK
jgi:hypothetical protein